MKTKENVRISKNCLKKTKRFQKKSYYTNLLSNSEGNTKKNLGSNKRDD